MKLILTPLSFFVFLACSSPANNEKTDRAPTQIELQTTKGTIILELSDKTPKHRDNFALLVEERAFDSLLFHRVINHFVIQAGDPDSKYATQLDTLGDGDRDYMVDAEFDTALFHKRGALGAARDGNGAKASSAMQFYIVQRGPQADSLIDQGENRINGYLAIYEALNLPDNEALKKARMKAEKEKRWEEYGILNDSLKSLGESLDFERYRIPDHQREVYRTLGGTPHLDQNYTVFGEVVKGMDVVDAIAIVQTSDLDRPTEDVRIISARIVKE